VRSFVRRLEARGGTGAAENIRAVEAVRGFIALHGASRFELVSGDAPDDPGVVNRAGFRKHSGRSSGGWDFFILPDVWRAEVCRGLDATRVARVLAGRGLLLPDPDGKRLATTIREPGVASVRAYCVPGTILGGDAGVT
jgi:uncharacterized protein (DUF927 family)